MKKTKGFKIIVEFEKGFKYFWNNPEKPWRKYSDHNPYKVQKDNGFLYGSSCSVSSKD